MPTLNMIVALNGCACYQSFLWCLLWGLKEMWGFHLQDGTNLWRDRVIFWWSDTYACKLKIFAEMGKYPKYSWVWIRIPYTVDWWRYKRRKSIITFPLRLCKIIWELPSHGSSMPGNCQYCLDTLRAAWLLSLLSNNPQWCWISTVFLLSSVLPCVRMRPCSLLPPLL